MNSVFSVASVHSVVKPLLLSLTVKRQPNIILRQRRARRARPRHVIQIRQMQLMRKRILIRKPVQHRRHPPRKSLHLPNPPQTNIRISLQSLARSALVKINQPSRQNAHIRNRKIQSLRSRRRNDMRRIAQQKQFPMPHRLSHKTPHRRHAFLQNRPISQRPIRRASQIASAIPSRCDRPTNPQYFRRARTADTAAKFPATACSAAQTRARGSNKSIHPTAGGTFARIPSQPNGYSRS